MVGAHLPVIFRGKFLWMAWNAEISLPTRPRRGWIVGVLASIALGALSAGAGDLKLSECPPEVRATILANLGKGDIDDIHRIRIEGHTLYLVDIDLKGFRDGKLHVSGTGVLRKSVREIRKKDLPPVVLDNLASFLKGRAHIEDIEQVFAEGKTRYHVEVEHPRQPDRHLVFEADGTIASYK